MKKRRDARAESERLFPEDPFDMDSQVSSEVTYYFWRNIFFQARIRCYPNQNELSDFKKALFSEYGYPSSEEIADSEENYRWNIRNRLVVILTKEPDDGQLITHDGRLTLTIGSAERFSQFVEQEKIGDSKDGKVFIYKSEEYGHVVKYGFDPSTLRRIERDIVQVTLTRVETNSSAIILLLISSLLPAPQASRRSTAKNRNTVGLIGLGG